MFDSPCRGVSWVFLRWLAWSLLLGGCAQRQVGISLLPPLIGLMKPAIFWSESFEQWDPARWRPIEVHGQTEYAVVDLGGRRCLKAYSHKNASIVVSQVRFDPHAYEQLSWEWRVDQLVDGEVLDRKDGSDAAARVYVYFDTPGLPWQRRNLDYVWSASLPVGTVFDSAYSSDSKIIVVESGPQHVGQWRNVTRNLADDFETSFGSRSPKVVAIGLMTDTDNTGGEALTYFDELRVMRRPRKDER